MNWLTETQPGAQHVSAALILLHTVGQAVKAVRSAHNQPVGVERDGQDMLHEAAEAPDGDGLRARLHNVAALRVEAPQRQEVVAFRRGGLLWKKPATASEPSAAATCQCTLLSFTAGWRLTAHTGRAACAL